MVDAYELKQRVKYIVLFFTKGVIKIYCGLTAFLVCFHCMNHHVWLMKTFVNLALHYLLQVNVATCLVGE